MQYCMSTAIKKKKKSSIIKRNLKATREKEHVAGRTEVRKLYAALKPTLSPSSLSIVTGTSPHLLVYLLSVTFHYTMAELSSCDRDYRAYKAKIIY